MSAGRKADDARFASQLVLTLGALALFVMFALIILPGVLGEGRVVPTIGVGLKAPASGEGWLDPVEAPAEKGRDIPPLDPATVMTANPELVARGKDVFAKNCVPCHGPEGKGDGPSAGSLKPPPRDFSRQSGWKNGYGITGIYRTLGEGIKGSGMVAYDFLTPKDRMALVHVVRSFGTFDHGPADEAAEAALAAQFKTAGGKVPNHIPVTSAIWRLQTEALPVRALVAPSGNDPALDLYRRAVVDPARASQVLAASSAWRTDAEALARSCVAGAPANGFSPRVAALAPGEWQALQAALVKALQ
jgi:mono/diheme cytochrome c family protein